MIINVLCSTVKPITEVLLTLGGSELCLVPPCQTTSSLPDNMRKTIRSATHTREQGHVCEHSSSPRDFSLEICLYLIIPTLCIFLFCFYTSAPIRQADYRAHESRAAAVCFCHASVFVFDFFFLCTLKRWSGVSRNRSLPHLSSARGWFWVSECRIVFKGLYLSFGTDRGVLECQESDNCGIVCCGCHHMKCCWFWRLELTFLLHKLLFVSQTALMLPLRWTSDVEFM